MEYLPVRRLPRAPLLTKRRSPTLPPWPILQLMSRSSARQMTNLFLTLILIDRSARLRTGKISDRTNFFRRTSFDDNEGGLMVLKVTAARRGRPLFFGRHACDRLEES